MAKKHKRANVDPEAKNWTVLCYEANEDGTLTLYLEDTDNHTNMNFTIEAYDVGRFMYAAIDALQGESSRR